MGDILYPTEAVYGFCAWLTTRNTPMTFSATHDAAKAAELCDAFCRANHLGEPSKSFLRWVIFPKEPTSD